MTRRQLIDANDAEETVRLTIAAQLIELAESPRPNPEKVSQLYSLTEITNRLFHPDIMLIDDEEEETDESDDDSDSEDNGDLDS